MSILLLALLAASGDAIYVKKDVAIYLADTAGKRTALDDVIIVTYPLDLNSFRALSCTKVVYATAAGISRLASRWRCTGTQNRPNITDAQALDLQIAGNGAAMELVDAAEVQNEVLSSTSTINTFVTAVFGASEALVAEFTCMRGSSPACMKNSIVTASPALWRTDLRAGLVLGTVGKVP